MTKKSVPSMRTARYWYGNKDLYYRPKTLYFGPKKEDTMEPVSDIPGRFIFFATLKALWIPMAVVTIFGVMFRINMSLCTGNGSVTICSPHVAPPTFLLALVFTIVFILASAMIYGITSEIVQAIRQNLIPHILKQAQKSYNKHKERSRQAIGK